MAKLRIVIIGNGIGGLCAAYCLGRAGHEVVVLERNTEVSEIGAGIQLAPNMSRLLIRWGLGEKLSQVGVKPEFLTFHRYENGNPLGFSWFGERMETDHGAPYYHIHRKDLIQMLYSLASPYMKLKLGCRVLSVDSSSSSVQLEGGSKLYGDLIIGADGFRSVAREAVAPRHPLKMVGDVAFRIIVPVDLLRRDEVLAELVTIPHIRCWMGPDKHVVAYLVKGGQEYNVVLIAPELDHQDTKMSWVAEGNMAELRAIYAGWDLRVQKLLDLATSCLKTKITYSEPLTNWTDPLARITLVGDACHPMLPYRAQAAAMAVEDAAVLGVLFSKIKNVTEIPDLLRAYQVIRAPRTAATLHASLLNRTTFHLADGVDQERRDQSMKASMEDALRRDTHSEHVGNANQWADRQKNGEQFDYDAEEAALAWLKSEDATQQAQVKL